MSMNIIAYLKACAGHGIDPANRHLQWKFIGWLFAWAIAFVTADALLVTEGMTTPMALLIAAVPAALAFVSVLAYLKFLKALDELMQRIQLEGFAIGFGIATAVYIGYALFEAYGGSTLGVHEAVVILMVAWSAGQLIAVARYR